jgi:hypothetical protein
MIPFLLVLLLLAVLVPGLVRGVFTLIGLCVLAALVIGGPWFSFAVAELGLSPT